ncbi:SchA/CurD-like domain-containing protein [Streptomyces sp. NPDC002851]
MTTTWHAMFYPLKDDADRAAGAALRTAEHIDTEVRGEGGRPVGHLLGSLVLVSDGTAVVAYEFEGPLPAAVWHLRTRVHADMVEPALRPHLRDVQPAECVIHSLSGV